MYVFFLTETKDQGHIKLFDNDTSSITKFKRYLDFALFFLQMK